MSLTLYGLKNCDTCKKALKALEAAGKAVTFVDIRAEADLAALLPGWLDSVGPDRLINRRYTLKLKRSLLKLLGDIVILVFVDAGFSFSHAREIKTTKVRPFDKFVRKSGRQSCNHTDSQQRRNYIPIAVEDFLVPRQVDRRQECREV